MNAREVVKEIMKESQLSYSVVGRRLKMSRGAISNRVNDGGMSLKGLIELLSIMDYDLVAVPRNKKGDSFVIEDSGR